MTADRSALLRDALTPGSTDDTIRRYLAEAPEPEAILDAEARTKLAQNGARDLRVLLVTLAESLPDHEPAWDHEGLRGGADLVDPRPLGPTREEEEAAWWADFEKWAQA